MNEKEVPSKEETVETVATTPEASTASTETTQAQETESVAWPPPGVPEEIHALVLALCQKFLPSKPLVEFVESESARIGLSNQINISDLIRTACAHLEKADLDWSLRFKHIFHSHYPTVEREVWSNSRICQRRYPRRQQESDYKTTFSISTLSPIKEPKNNLGSKIAPALYMIHINNDGTGRVTPTSEAERFFNGERMAVPRSSLSEVVLYNRPTWGIENGWQPYQKGFLPKRNETPKLVSQVNSESLIGEFVDDLQETFSWENDEQCPRYLGMLIQPMIAHLSPGQNPAYAVLGPTKSGKGYLSSVLPAVLYSRNGDPTVLVKKMPNSTYEMEVFLGTCREALFLCLDEVKNASDEEFKMIDAMCTQENLQARIMRQGYYEIPNLITICMTAVHQNFTDETYGRLATMKLNESRSEMVADFHSRWKHRGPELLSSLFHRISGVSFDYLNLKRVPDRRPGFSVVAYFVEQVFGMRPNYAVDSTSHDVLDDLCRMYEEARKWGTDKGPWKRYTAANFVSFMAENYDRRWKRSSAASAINTALGYKSTLNHPNYKTTGYPAESGKHYHIDVREEGIRTKRSFIYIREVMPNEDS